MTVLAATTTEGNFLQQFAPLVDLGTTAALIAAILWFGRWLSQYYIRNISSGEWVPRRELDYTRLDRDARLAEKDAELERCRITISEWRAAHETSERTRELLTGQNRDLIDITRTQQRFFDAFRSFVDQDSNDIGHTANDA
jgi:hypothetical protein